MLSPPFQFSGEAFPVKPDKNGIASSYKIGRIGSEGLILSTPPHR